MRKAIYVLSGIVLLLSIFAFVEPKQRSVQTLEPKVVPKKPAPKNIKVTMKIKNRGIVVLELYPSKAPKTTAHILSLIDKKFYDGQRFHRVEDWVVQWGDPGSRNPSKAKHPIGTGGSGKNVPFEDTGVRFSRGTLGLASTGLKVGGDSQMFILRKDAFRLDGNYCAFGRVVKGMDVVDKIKKNDIIVSMRRS